MALPTYFGSGTFTTGLASISPPFPANTLADDIALLVCESENEVIALFSPGVGFVEVTNSPQSAGTAATNPANRIAIFWKRLVGGDTAPTIVDSGNHNTGQIHVFRGVKTTGDPWNITSGGNDGGANDTSGVIPGATTTVADCLVVLVCGSSFNGTSGAEFSGWTNADLANILERTDNTHTVGLGGGHGMATGEKATSGAYGNTTVTLANTSFKGAMSVALEGAAAATPEIATRQRQAEIRRSISRPRDTSPTNLILTLLAEEAPFVPTHSEIPDRRLPMNHTWQDVSLTNTLLAAIDDPFVPQDLGMPIRRQSRLPFDTQQNVVSTTRFIDETQWAGPCSGGRAGGM